jgi:hypothetical protein
MTFLACEKYVQKLTARYTECCAQPCDRMGLGGADDTIEQLGAPCQYNAAFGRRQNKARRAKQGSIENRMSVTASAGPSGRRQNRLRFVGSAAEARALACAAGTTRIRLCSSVSFAIRVQASSPTVCRLVERDACCTRPRGGSIRVAPL